jgi:hypothetical protein
MFPELRTGQTVIMDNAAFHKTKETKNPIESADCRLFLSSILARLESY